MTSISPDETDDSDILYPTRLAMERALLVSVPRTEVILVRHAQQDFSLRAHTEGGALGPGLSATGQDQADLVADWLADEEVAAVYCSPLTRARRTAEAIARRHPGAGELQVSSLLQEVDIYGAKDRNGFRLDPEVQQRAAEEFVRTRRWDAFPATETSADARSRMIGEITRLVQLDEGGRICVVSHGAAISTFLAAILGVEDDMFFFCGHTGVTRVWYGDDQWALHSVNELGHVRSKELVTF
jgi:probable phosphoglycerate mutase